MNPASGRGATGRRWRSLVPCIRDELGAVEIATTRAPRDAERLAREGVRSGIERIVVVGGDGTLSEVATGLLGAGLAGYASLGLVPMATGGDFARSLGIPREPAQAVASIARGTLRAIDAGRIAFVLRDGAKRTTYFMNIASLGISGLIDEWVHRTPKALGGRAAFLIGALRGLACYRSVPTTLRVDGDIVHEGPLVLAAVANGAYFGGGMHVAPAADLADGRFDVVVIPDLSKARLLRKLPSLYSGSHVDDPSVRVVRGEVVEAESGPGMWIDVDGEPLGHAPIRSEVLPSAIQLAVPK